MATNRTSLQERYELKEVLGRGGMGVVYKAYDTLMKRDVALKTILDIDNPETIAQFYKEWSILATMVHPNIVGIYDIGEFAQDGVIRPFFVMPLLPGVTLDKLIQDGSPRLTVEGVLEIIQQSCRGLHAAHEQGLVHRDVKPSNIFVMDDNSVKIIDFGIARMASARSRTNLKGTLYYLAPEQLELKPPSPLSDLFALGVVTYEALTRRRPFQGATDTEVIEAIQRHIPPPVSEINQNASYAISQVVHKAIAKQPWHRFFNMREFGESLEKAFRNEPIEYFDSAKIKPRLERAARSFEQGDYAFASEVLGEMEAEGQLDQEIGLLRGRLDQAMRQVRIKQLLESARRFFEAQEYPLALRKIQEALDLDSNDADALSLRGLVEKERREKKIEEWIAVARQHLDNQSFRQARDALDNVITLKPNDTEALQLMAEVGRCEQEVAQVREEKSRLYQAATQAWEKGEVTLALSKLEILLALDRERPEADSGRASSYQNLYNQVRSEHDALKNAYGDAKRNLSSDNFESALAVCRQYLAKYPNHALFQALKYDVEERRRHSLSAVIAETDRRVEQEADLDRRMGILEEALKLYPGETHFEEATRLVRDKRDLVNSIVAKAHFFEGRGQYNEALDQWQILRSIHENQPGLAFEIQRLIKRRDQQAQENAKSRWVEQADKYLEAGDYDRAMKTVQNALAEFPGDAELLELDKLVCKNQERGQQALDLLNRARECGEKGAPEDILPLLREAHQIDPRNTVIRTVLVNSLLEQARALADSDWQSADAALEEVLRLEPQHAPAQSLSSQIADRRREDFIALRLADARRMQTDGDFAGALGVVDRAIESFPAEPRLQQLRATLQRAQADAERAATGSRDSSRRDIPLAALQPAVNAAVEPTAPIGPVSAPAAARPLPARRPRRMVAAVVFGAAAALAVVATVAGFGRSNTPTSSPARAFKVSLRSSPPGAAIRVADKPCGSSTCDIQLPPGTYEVQAQLAGYQPLAMTFDVNPTQDAPADVKLALVPAPAIVTVSTDLTEGTVSLDDELAARIQGGELEVTNITPGKHTLSVQSGAFHASIPLEIKPGAIPKLDGAMQTVSLKGFVVARSGAEARLYSSVGGVQATLNGKPAGVVGPDGLEVKDFPPGPQDIVLDGPGSHRQNIAFEPGPESCLYVSLVTDRNLGVLRVNAGDDDVAVYFNGQKYRRATKNGRLLAYLTPKRYAVRVEKEGFATPPEQIVELRKGEETKLDFKMLPLRASLALHGAVPNAEVWLDGLRIGNVRPDGGFSASEIETGKHVVTLKSERFKTFQSEQVFAAGKSVELEPKMETLMGAVKIDLSPAGIGAKLRIRRDGDAHDREITETTLTLPEGAYTITGSAPRHLDATTSVRVAADRTVTAALLLKEIKPVIKAEKRPGFVLGDWAKAGGWKQDGPRLVHRGGDFVVAPVNLRQGSIVFTGILLRGKRMQWMLDFESAKNHCLFQIDDKNFNRIEVIDGKRSEAVKIPHGVDRKGYISIAIVVTPDSITHSILRDRRWQVLDKWQRPHTTRAGAFGFHLPGRDEIGLSDFRFTPE